MNSPLIPSLRHDFIRPPFGIESLPIPVEWMRYCEACDSQQRFVAERSCELGLISRCVNCGEERLAPFTRTNGGAWEEYT